MSSSISEAQNEEKILKFLFFARQKYNFIEKLNYSILITILVSFIISLIDLNASVKIIIAAISTFYLYIIKSIVNKILEQAAQAKDVVDRKLFGFHFAKSIEEKLTQEAEIVSQKNKKKYLIQSSNNGTSEERGVKDWYTTDPNLSLGEQICRCQDENIYWDKELAKFWKILLLIFGGSLIIAIPIIFFAINKKSSVEILIYYVSNAALLLKVYSEVSVIKKYDENNIKIIFLQEIRSKINENNCNDRILMEEMQKLIFERRKINFTIPDFIHKIKSKFLHSVWNGINQSAVE